MKRICFILALFLVLINPVFSASSFVKKDLSVQASDGFTLKATLEYPKVKGQKEFEIYLRKRSIEEGEMHQKRMNEKDKN